ncbi:MAG: hypothetical protein WCO60_07570 [Verrucomicrobiota bacterium]
MKTEAQEHDDLWELLGKSNPPTLPPDFTRKVMASVEVLEATQVEQTSTRRSFGWITIGLGAAAAIWVSLASPKSSDEITSPDDAQLVALLASHQLSPGDLRLLSHLDEVLDAELSDLWSDSL